MRQEQYIEIEYFAGGECICMMKKCVQFVLYRDGASTKGGLAVAYLMLPLFDQVTLGFVYAGNKSQRLEALGCVLSALTTVAS